jgi:hypothetical protein
MAQCTPTQQNNKKDRKGKNLHMSSASSKATRLLFIVNMIHYFCSRKIHKSNSSSFQVNILVVDKTLSPNFHLGYECSR